MLELAIGGRGCKDCTDNHPTSLHGFKLKKRVANGKDKMGAETCHMNDHKNKLSGAM